MNISMVADKLNSTELKPQENSNDFACLEILLEFGSRENLSLKIIYEWDSIDKERG